MADTSTQLEAARWIRAEFLPKELKQTFERREVPLTSGGRHEFAAVSDDGMTIGTITTGRSTTSGSNNASGKLNKIRADLYFLLLTRATRRFIVCADEGMYNLLLKERDDLHRIPAEIEIYHAPLPDHLAAKLADAQSEASTEVGG